MSFLHASLLCGVLAVFRWCLGGIFRDCFFLTKLAHLSVPNWHQRKRETLQLEVVFFVEYEPTHYPAKKRTARATLATKMMGFEIELSDSDQSLL